MRLGSFSGPTAPYGAPSPIVHPTDNDITPDAAVAEADAAKSRAEALFEDLQNALRDKNAPKTT